MSDTRSSDRGPIRISCFGSSSPNLPRELLEDAYKLGRLIAEAGWIQINGAGKLGIMGALTDGGKAGGGRVEGIIIEAYLQYRHERLDCCETAGDFNRRKERLIEEGDFLVCLPGGIGTLSEMMHAADDHLVEIYYQKPSQPPAFLLNTGGYYTGLYGWLEERIVGTGALAASSFTKLFELAETPEDVIGRIRSRL